MLPVSSLGALGLWETGQYNGHAKSGLCWLSLAPSLPDPIPHNVGCSQNGSRLSSQEFTLFLVQVKNPEVPLKGKKEKGLFKGAQYTAVPTFQGCPRLLISTNF